MFQNVIKKVKDNNLTINNADKGNVLVIENKDKLRDKTLDFLNNKVFVKLKSDPTQRFQMKIKNAVKQSALIIDPKHVSQIINSNPKAPNLRSTTKIHKPNAPIRPIVNYMPAPAYRVKKLLNKYLKQKLIIEHKYNIINSNKLSTTLKTLKINKHMKFISLDIKDMYSNIPVQETIKIIQNQLNILNTDQKETEQLISLLLSS